MISRRTLLSSLSALVAAPLAKWLPKREPTLQPGMFIGSQDGVCVVAGETVWCDGEVEVISWGPLMSREDIEIEWRKGSLNFRPIPQEEA
jgi:hypothetical protein